MSGPQRGLGFSPPDERTPRTDEEDWIRSLEEEYYGQGREGGEFTPPIQDLDPEFLRRNQQRFRRAYDAGRQQNMVDRKKAWAPLTDEEKRFRDSDKR